MRLSKIKGAYAVAPQAQSKKEAREQNQEHFFYKPCSVFALQQTMTIYLESSLRSFASGLPEKKPSVTSGLKRTASHCWSFPFSLSSP